MIATHPRAIQSHRTVTEQDRVPGVMWPTFKCRFCSGFKKTSGRKKHPAGGFKCADCVGREVRDGNGAQKELASS